MVFSPNGPRVEVEPAPIEPVPYGLFSTATVIDEAAGPWQLGYHYPSSALCGAQSRVWAGPCSSLTEDRDPPVAVTITVALSYGPVVHEAGGDFYPVLAAITPNPTSGLPAEMVVQARVPARPWVDVPVSTIGPVRIGDVRADLAFPIKIATRVSGAGVPPTASAEITLTAPPGGTSSGNLVFSYASDASGSKTRDGGQTWITGDVFTLYATADCFAPGFAEVAGPLAASRLEAGAEMAVERYLWSLFGKMAGEKAAQDIPSNATVIDGLRRLDVAVTKCVGGLGVLHLPRESAYCLACARAVRTTTTADGRERYVSALATPVTFGLGYDGAAGPVGMAVPAGQMPVYATGPVVIRRGPVMQSEQFDQWTNQYVAVAERVVGVTWDCCFLSGVISQCGGCDCPT